MSKNCPKCGRWEEKGGHRCPKKKTVSPAKVSSRKAPSVAAELQPMFSPEYDSVYAAFTQELLFKTEDKPSVAVENVESANIEGQATVADMLAEGHTPMWLTAREIRQHWQALDGDKQESFKRAKEKESEEELWERKLDEALWRNDMGDPISDEYEDEDGEWVDNYQIVDGKRVPGDLEWTLLQDIKVNGVLYPVSLQFNRDSVGSAGKPEILGGHHRVALMGEYNPDGFIPVEFFDDPEQARKGLGWQY